MNKVCSRCKREQILLNFAKRSRSIDGRSSWCKECFKEYDRIRYQNGDAGRKKTNWINRVRNNRVFIKDYFENNPCVDCGETDWWALEFDHRNQDTKEKDLSVLIMEAGLDKIKREIEKCDVRCTKCHRKRTIFQLGWWQKEFLTT